MLILNNLKNIRKSLLGVAFVLFVAFSCLNINKTEAFGCANCSQVSVQMEELGKQIYQTSVEVSTKVSTAGSFSNSIWQVLKEKVMDKAGVAMAKAAIKAIQFQTIQWINSGFKGKPMFMTNPDLFFQGILIDHVSVVKDVLIKDLRYLNESVARGLLLSVQDPLEKLKQGVKGTLDTEICAAIKKEYLSYEDSYKRSPNATILRLAQIKKDEYNKTCASTVNPANKQKNVTMCASSYACSGSTGFLSITQNLSQNTEAGRLKQVLDYTNQQVAKDKTNYNNELVANGGFFSQTKCIPGTEQTTTSGRTICQRETETPGTVAASVLNNFSVSSQTQLELADTLDEAIAAVGNAFINKLYTEGLRKVSGAIDINSVNQSLSNMARDLNVDTNNLIKDISLIGVPTNNNNNGSSILGNNNGSQTGSINQQDLAFTINTLKPTSDLKVSEGEKAKELVNKEISAYVAAVASFERVTQCYFNKNVEQQAYKSQNPSLYTDEYFGQYLLYYPKDSTPAELLKGRPATTTYYINKISEYKSIINGLNAKVEAHNKAVLDTDALWKIAAATTSLSFFENLINNFKTDPNLLDYAEWQTRDFQNSNNLSGLEDVPASNLYARLERERSVATVDKIGNIRDGELIPSDLTTCTNWQIVPPTNNGN